MADNDRLFELKDLPQEVRAAAQHRFGADLNMATPKPDGLYKGEVLNLERYLVQEVGPRSVVFHSKENLELVGSNLAWRSENNRMNGASVQIGYDKEGYAQVYPYDRSRDDLERIVSGLKKSAKELGVGGKDTIELLDRLKEQSWTRLKDIRRASREAVAERAQSDEKTQSAEGKKNSRLGWVKQAREQSTQQHNREAEPGR